LLATIHPQLQRRRPDYDSLNKLARVRANFLAGGIRVRPHAAVTHYVLGRLKSREALATLRHLEFRAAEMDAIAHLTSGAQKVLKSLKGRTTNAPRDAYSYIASVPPEVLAFIEVEMPHPRALAKVRNYVQKWRPMRLALPAGELDALGIPRGPKFDKILEQLFELQLRGKARAPEDRTKALRQLAGIKEEPVKKVEKPHKKKDGSDDSVASALKHREKPEPAPVHAPAPAKGGGKGKPSEHKARPAKKSRGR